MFYASAAHVPLVLSCLLDPCALAADFEHVIVPVICFLVICFLPCLLPDTDLFHVSSTCVTGFVSFAFTVCWLTLNRSLFWFYCIWYYLLTRHWFVQCQQHLYIGVILQYNSGSMAADFEQVTVSIRLFFTCVLCIWIILDKGWHILYVFGLNCAVYNHKVGVHFSSDLWLMTSWWMLTCIIVFYCVCVSKVSSNLQCALVYDTIF